MTHIDHETLPPDPKEFTDLSPHPPSDPTLSVLCDVFQEVGVMRGGHPLRRLWRLRPH